jgi:aryl-alcohol dehydrogenase-like predicted oxidoreductase
MQYRTLGRSGLKVSAITMGTFTFGGEGPFGMVGKQGVAEAQRLVDLCIDHGVNLFDTANMYSTGTSETILGEVLEGRYADILVTSKVRMRIGDGPNDEGASRWHIIRECERSLKRLRTDHIDLYYIHEWDGLTPVEETMAALDTLVQQGKVRYTGCSNYSAWHVMKSLAAAGGAPGRFATQQIHYTLEAREAEYELLPLSVDQGLGVLVWSPLAAGLLTGKYQDGGVPKGSRRENGPDLGGRYTERALSAVKAYLEIAERHGLDPVHMALAFTVQRPFPVSTIFGATTSEQLARIIGGLDVTLDAAVLEEIEATHRAMPMTY